MQNLWKQACYNKGENENLSSTSLDNQRSDCDQENERENAFNPPVIETEKVINDISDNSREPLTVQSTPSIVAINETSSPLDYSVIARIEAINEISPENVPFKIGFIKELYVINRRPGRS